MFLIYGVQSYTQENLIPNPGFEDFFDCDFDLIRDPIEEVIPEWYTRLGRPRYFQEECKDEVGEELPHVPFLGNGFLTLITFSSVGDEESGSLRDYIIVSLKENLRAGHDYYIEYYGALSFFYQASHSHHGILFTNEFINETDFSAQRDNPPLIESKALVVDSISFTQQGRWERHQHCFSSDSSYNYMVVGNFTHLDTLMHEPFTDTFCCGTFTSYDNFFLAEIEQEVRLDEYEERICAGHCITLSTNHSLIDGTFEWQLPGSDILTSSDSTVTICYDQPGVYDVHLDVQHCTGDYSGDFPEAVTVFEALDFTGPDDAVLCPQESFTFSIPDIFTVLWSDGSTDRNRILAIPGIYEYELGNGTCVETFTFELQHELEAETQENEMFACQGEGITFQGNTYMEPGFVLDTISSFTGCDSIYLITVFDFYEDIAFDLESDEGFCPGEEAVISVQSAHENILWSDGDMQEERTFSSPVNLTLRGVDPNGCPVDTQIQVIAYPTIGVQTKDILDLDFSPGTPLPVTYSGEILSYTWTPRQALSCDDCPFPTLDIAQAGIYQIEIVNEQGCTDVAQLRIQFDRVNVYLPTVISKSTNNFENSLLFAQSNSDINYSLRVYNKWGGQEYDGANLIANNPAEGWVPAADDLGVFVYYLLYEDENNQEQLVTGEVTVVD